jgi:hypothetical protein
MEGSGSVLISPSTPTLACKDWETLLTDSDIVACLQPEIWTQNSKEWLSFWNLSIVRFSKKLDDISFRKLGLFPFSGEGEDTYSVGSHRKS